MRRRTAGSALAGIAAAGFLATAGLHATGYDRIARLAGEGPADLQTLGPALWLSFSFDLMVLGLVVGMVALRPAGAGRAVLAVASLMPLGAAGLQLAYLGFIPPTVILLGLGALTLAAAVVLPGSPPGR